MVKNNRTGVLELQNFIDDKLINNNEKYFTIVQYDGGPIVNLENCIVFSCGGMFGTKLNSNTSFIKIPLLSDNHKRKNTLTKKYKACFLGRDTHPVRKELTKIIKSNNNYRVELLENMFITKKNEKNFKKLIQESYFSLCPRGYGPASFRFYESFNLGTVPIYISDEFHLPFTELIDWEKLCLLVKPEEISSIPKKIEDLLNTNAYKEMLNYGQFCSQKFFNYDFTINYILKVISNFK